MPKLNDREFTLFRELILENCGIKMADTKRLLLQNRIGRRLKALSIPTFNEYYQYIQTPKGKLQELSNLWSLVTTNETHFFRENHHFDLLKEVVFEDLSSRKVAAKKLRVWSAGCSTGQEVYTLAMVLDEYFSRHKGWSWSVMGSDLDSEVLKA
ncbi:hypothetical protein KAI87_14760, partial [Myxococcota bacterium]|nr:hypothetical protein [Myxococcota bacterium]